MACSEDVKDLGCHKRGDTYFGHLWVVYDPGGPRDITDDDYFVDFRTAAAATTAAWSLSSTDDPGGLTKMDGDGRTVELANGVSIELEPLGYPYIVQLDPAIPPLAARKFYWDLQQERPNGVVITLESGTITITQDVTRTE